ncbi:hypothetical protein HAX54_011621 [Datura stramonium]|uniref:Uncharacterized protein n=1 Tax=Datura stramonium TaxID=4076 RepID=A0ABS8TK81_DATST|nr:hypothetical protein [Datura stramonium]
MLKRKYKAPPKEYSEPRRGWRKKQSRPEWSQARSVKVTYDPYRGTVLRSKGKLKHFQTRSCIHCAAYRPGNPHMVVMAKKFSRLEPNWGWITVCQLAEAYKPRINSSMIRWTRPIGDIWKLNTDGSFKERHKVAGIGGIVRKEMEIWSLLSQDLSNSRLTMPAS